MQSFPSRYGLALVRGDGKLSEFLHWDGDEGCWGGEGQLELLQNVYLLHIVDMCFNDAGHTTVVVGKHPGVLVHQGHGPTQHLLAFHTASEEGGGRRQKEEI